MIAFNFWKIFSKTRKLGYKKIYVAVDIHETILKPSWSVDEPYNFYLNAKEVLQMMSKSDKFVLILWSSCYDDKLKKYASDFETKFGIHFDYLNENPDARNTDYAYFGNKFYFDIGFDDKFGFCPNVHWFLIRCILKIKHYLHQI